MAWLTPRQTITGDFGGVGATVETVVLTWRILNADVVQMQAFGRFAPVGAEGNMLVAPLQNTTYQLVATGPDGSTSSALTVVVRPTPVTPPHQPLAEPMTAVESTDMPIIRVESPNGALSATPPPATATSTSTITATPTLAPVTFAPLSVTLEVATPAIFTQPDAQIMVTPLLMLVGLAVLIGLPLLGVATLLLVWLIHRPQ